MLCMLWYMVLQQDTCRCTASVQSTLALPVVISVKLCHEPMASSRCLQAAFQTQQVYSATLQHDPAFCDHKARASAETLSEALYANQQSRSDAEHAAVICRILRRTDLVRDLCKSLQIVPPFCNTAGAERSAIASVPALSKLAIGALQLFVQLLKPLSLLQPTEEAATKHLLVRQV